jgi:riboflavin kinase/FMN adenylyltransferase
MLYGRTIEVDFLSRLRDIQRFHSVAELVSQMDRDLEATRRIASPPSVHNECQPFEE